MPNALVIVVWQEIPESTKFVLIVPKDQAEYDLLMSFHNKFINSDENTNELCDYFFSEDGSLKFLPETDPIELLGVDGAKFVVITTGIML